MKHIHKLIKWIKKNPKPAGVIGLLILIILIINPFGGNPQATTKDDSNQIPEVKLLNLEEYISDEQKISVTGEIESLEQVELSSEVFGKIARVNVKLGDEVYPGQVIASFSNGDIASQVSGAQAEYERAQATKEQLTAQYEAQQANHEKLLVTTQNTIAAAQSSLDSAENNLKLNQTTADSQIVNDAYDNLRNTLQTIEVSIANTLTVSDNILGIDNTLANDDFEDVLGALSMQKKSHAKMSYLQAKKQKEDVSDIIPMLNAQSTHQELDDAAHVAQTAVSIMQAHLSDMQALLEATVPIGDLSQTELTTLKTNISTARTNINTISTSLTTTLQAITTAKTNLSSYQIAYDKAVRDLTDTKAQVMSDIAASESGLTQMQATIKAQDAIIASARASVGSASASLGKTIIRTPIAGTVAVLPAKTGEIINNGGLVASIVNTEGFQVTTHIDSKELAGISVGNPAYVDGKSIGTITNVAPSIDPTTKKVEVIVALDTTQLQIGTVVAGQFVSVDLVQIFEETEDSPSILLPLSAVRIEPDKKTVISIDENNRVVEYEITIDRIIGDKIEVTDGLQDISSIILSTRGLEVGDEVAVIQ